MQHNHLALQRDLVADFLQVHHDMWEAAKSMDRGERHAAIQDIYAESDIVRVSDADDAAYSVDAMRVAHIQIQGILTPKADPCAALFGGSETEYGFIRAAVDQAEIDPRVDRIALEIDSPGGYVAGCDETGMAIADARKKTVAVVHNMAASAAYWLATQADEIIAASPSAMVGSIGVAMEIVDRSEANKSRGIQVRTFTSTEAPDKRVDPSTESGAAKITSKLDDLHDVFVSRVAAGRGVSAEKVNADFGRGDIVIAGKASMLGMIDGIQDVVKQSDSLVVDEHDAAAAASTVPAIEAGITEDFVNRVEFMKEHPDLYAELQTEFVKAGVDQERARVKSLKAWQDASASNAKLQELVGTAIADGSTAADIQPQLMAAMIGGKAAGENPPPVETAEAAAAEDDSIEESMTRLRAAGAFTEAING